MDIDIMGYIVTLGKNWCQQIDVVMFLTWSSGFQQDKNVSDFKKKNCSWLGFYQF